MAMALIAQMSRSIAITNAEYGHNSTPEAKSQHHVCIAALRLQPLPQRPPPHWASRSHHFDGLISRAYQSLPQYMLLFRSSTQFIRLSYTGTEAPYPEAPRSDKELRGSAHKTHPTCFAGTFGWQTVVPFRKFVRLFSVRFAEELLKAVQFLE